MEPESYAEQKARLKEETASKTREDIKAELESRSEYVADLNNMPRVEHNWVRRGIKISCEYALHPHHSHFLVGKNK